MFLETLGLDLTKVEDLAKIDETIDLWIKKYNDSYNKVLKNVKLQKNYIQQHKVNNKEVQKGFKKIKNLKLKIYNLIEALESN